MSSVPQRQPAHSANATPVAQQDSGIGGIAWAVAVASGLGAHIAGPAWALSRTSAYALDVLVFATVMSAFEVRTRSLSGRAEEGGDASRRRRHWLPAVVRATAVAASIHVLYDATYERGTSALGRLLVPAGASLDEVSLVGRWALLAVGVLIVAIVATVRAIRRKLRR
jgi:hypothetical protein